MLFIFFDRLVNDGFEFNGDFGIDDAHRHGRTAQDGFDDYATSAAGKRFLSSGHFI